MVSNAAIEASLRQAVREASKRKEQISVNIVRARVEEDLDLGQDFFKSNADWTAKSKGIINDAFEEEEEDDTVDEEPAKEIKAQQAGKKRRSTGEQGGPKKKAKRQLVVKSIEEDESSQSDTEDEVEAKPRKAARVTKPAKPKQTKRKISKPSALSSEPAESATASPAPSGMDQEDSVIDMKTSGKEETNGTTHDHEDDSDMSSLIDDTPPPKKRRQKKSTSPPAEKRGQSKRKSTGTALTPDEELVKTLQSQLRKCGIQKLWHRELASCETTKDKIRHLKQMLVDVGMSGKFSAEKAQQIKERRELAADMESTKEFQKNWGIEIEPGRPRRTRTTKQLRDAPEDSDEATAPPAQGGLDTGLVDFGDSGDDGSDWD